MDITLHICGDTSSIYDLIPEIGADLFSLDQLDLSAAVEKIGGKIRLIGNLSPNKLLSSSESVIDNECSLIIKNGISNKKGFVFSTGCEVPIRIDRHKLESFIRLGKDMHYDK